MSNLDDSLLFEHKKQVTLLRVKNILKFVPYVRMIMLFLSFLVGIVACFVQFNVVYFLFLLLGSAIGIVVIGTILE